jgi:hypothetical protein
MSAPDPLAGWLPFFLSGRGGQAAVEWGYAGPERLTEPFFHDSLQRLMARPLNQGFRRQTPLERLAERARTHPGLPLCGIVFHMSRCGSTLVAQSLAALGDSVVLSEPEPVGTLLEWLIPAPPSEAGAELLRGLLSALGQPRRAEDRRLFIKTECWHVCHIDRILAAFPGVPWAFVYREPLEVLVSQAHIPSLYLMPGTGVRHGLAPPEDLLCRPLEHAAWMLAAMLRAAADAIRRHPGGLLMNYQELPDGLETRLAGHFGLALGEADIEAWQRVRARDAKQPHQPFQADSAEKRAAANAGLREAAARWLDEPYAELERLRRESHGQA